MATNQSTGKWIYAPLILLSLIILFPILWMISTVFKRKEDLFISPPEWIPLHPTLQTLKSILSNGVILTYAKNSLLVAVLVTVICMLIALLAAYSLARMDFPGKDAIMLFLLATQMFPQVMLLIPLYKFFSGMGVLNTIFSLVLVHLSIALPLSIWLAKGYFDTIPKELEEAAVIDGASQLGILFRIILPIAMPGMVVVGLFSFLASWDEYLFTFTLVSDDAKRTLPVGMVSQFFGQYSYAWDQVMTLSLLMTLPILILFLFFQRYIVQGLTAGAIKG